MNKPVMPAYWPAKPNPKMAQDNTESVLSLRVIPE